MKLYWNKKQVDFLKKWYPHFGTHYVALKLKLSFQQVKSKADKLKLHLLPKNKRRCIKCIKGFQFARRGGYFCYKCFNKRRYYLRRNKPKTLKQRFDEILRSCKRRSSVPCNLTTKYLLKLWKKQKGKCYYSNIPMIIAQYGTGRNAYSLSLDQVKPQKGYIKTNIVLCCWIVNAGKSNLSYQNYFNVCKDIVNNNKNMEGSTQWLRD